MQPGLPPTEVRLSADKSTLHISWPGQQAPLSAGLQAALPAALPAEYLRVESPSAEVKGHGPGSARLVAGKQAVRITGLEAVGAYALKIIFSDGHATGLYTWAYLQELATQQPTRWQTYLNDLAAAGLNREEAATAPRRLAQPPKMA